EGAAPLDPPRRTRPRVARGARFARDGSTRAASALDHPDGARGLRAVSLEAQTGEDDAAEEGRAEARRAADEQTWSAGEREDLDRQARRARAWRLAGGGPGGRRRARLARDDRRRARGDRNARVRRRYGRGARRGG